ncbi:MAG: hypothetical protein E6G66_18645, partial [Actinobacteria bacterium]
MNLASTSAAGERSSPRGLGRLAAIAGIVPAWRIFVPSGPELLAEPLGPLLRGSSALELASKALAEPLEVALAQTLGDPLRDRLGGVLGGEAHRDEIG